jgi:hypothetical protein
MAKRGSGSKERGRSPREAGCGDDLGADEEQGQRQREEHLPKRG